MSAPGNETNEISPTLELRPLLTSEQKDVLKDADLLREIGLLQDWMDLEQSGPKSTLMESVSPSAEACDGMELSIPSSYNQNAPMEVGIVVVEWPDFQSGYVNKVLLTKIDGTAVDIDVRQSEQYPGFWEATFPMENQGCVVQVLAVKLMGVRVIASSGSVPFTYRDVDVSQLMALTRQQKSIIEQYERQLNMLLTNYGGRNFSPGVVSRTFVRHDTVFETEECILLAKIWMILAARYLKSLVATIITEEGKALLNHQLNVVQEFDPSQPLFLNTMLGDNTDAAKSLIPDTNARSTDIVIDFQNISGLARVHIGHNNLNSMLGNTANAAKSTFPDLNARTGDIAIGNEDIGGSARVHIGDHIEHNIYYNHPTPTIPKVSPGVHSARSSSPQYYIPFRRNKQFVGRAKTIDELHLKLFQENCGRVALVGLGGVGKTQVALEFAHRVKDTERDCSVFWISALSWESFELAYNNIAEILGIGRDAGKQKDILKTVHDYLSQRKAGRCLLIVDNADDDRILRGIEPFIPESDDSRILFTTRTRSVAVTAAQTHIVRLDQMDEKEARTFFQTALICGELASNDPSVTGELLKYLTYLPLAINQAAAYLNTNEPTTCKQYMDILKRTEKDGMGLLSVSSNVGDEQRSDIAVATTWAVSFNRIRELNSTAANLLLFIACIESKEIPESILPRAESITDFQTAIGILLGYNFLSVSRQQENRTSEVVYTMHRRVHLSAKLWLSKESRMMEAVKNACQHISNIFPTTEWKNREIWRKYLPHTVNILGIREGKELVERYDLCHKLAKTMMVDGKFEDAVPYLEECAGRKQKLDTLQHDHLNRSMSELWFNHIGRPLRNFTQTLWSTPNQSTERQWTASDLDLRQELALAYLYSDQFDKAEELLLLVITEKKRTMKDGNPSLLQSQHELARACRLQGKKEEALNLLAQVLADSKNTLESGHVVRQAIKQDRQNWMIEDVLATSDGSMGAVVWTDVLKTNGDVVDLTGRSIGNDGASVVANALRENKMWRFLNLRVNSITERGAEALTEGLKSNSTLVRLDLG
ncbi:hypothetical protein HDU93_000702, partial [Gonapodya sp. JEL0774]